MRDGVARLVQLATLYITVFHVGPFLETKAEWLGPIGGEVVALLVTFAVTEVLIAVFVSRPEIILNWQDGTNPNALKEIIVDSASLVGGRARYDLSIEAKPGSSLGSLAFKLARKRALTMHVEFPTAPVYLIVDLSMPVRERGKTVTEVAGNYGVDVTLDTDPPPATWVWARLIMQSVPPIGYVTNQTFQINIALRTSSRLGNVCQKFIKTRSTASILVLHR